MSKRKAGPTVWGIFSEEGIHRAILDDFNDHFRLLTIEGTKSHKDRVEAFAERFNRHWRRSASEIIQAGKVLAEAKHAGCLPALIKRLKLGNGDPGSGKRTADRLIRIGSDPRLSTHVSLMPQAWGTLDKIAGLSDEEFNLFIQDGTIHPFMQRNDLAEAQHRLRQKKKRKEATDTAHITPDGLTTIVDDCRRVKLPPKSVNAFIFSPPYFGLQRDYDAEPLIWGGDPNCKHVWQTETTSPFKGKWKSDSSYFRKWADPNKKITRGCCAKCGATQSQLGAEKVVEFYVANIAEVFETAIKEPLRDDGLVFLVVGTCFQRRQDLSVEAHIKLALHAVGWLCVDTIIWVNPNRCPENVSSRTSRNHEYVLVFAKGEEFYYDANAIRELAVCAGKPAKADSGRDTHLDTRICRSVWTIPTTSQSGTSHPAPFPPELIEPMVLAGCPKGGVVCDIMAGSGTSGLVALGLERKAVLIEQSAKYMTEARERIARELESYQAELRQRWPKEFGVEDTGSDAPSCDQAKPTDDEAKAA
jgi:DNA modification methylase